MAGNTAKPEIDIPKLVNDIRAALEKELKGGIGSVKTLVESQGRKIALFTKMIASERAFGSLRDDDEGFQHFMGRLEAHTRELALTVAGMTILTLQQAWNSIVGVVWGALNKLLTSQGLIAVPIPGLPGA